jgi:sec-independent protein translocase protein TatC
MANPIPANLPADNGANEDAGRMSFFDHLNELRTRIMWSAGAIVFGTFVAFAIAKRVLHILELPMQKALGAAGFDPNLVSTSPTGVINLTITMALYLGIVIASPIVFYQVWLFIAPGLYKHERRGISIFLFFSVFLFLTGIAFGYFIMLPYLIKFIIGFQGDIRPFFSINEYFDMVCIVFLGLGLIFELPVLIFFLALFGIVTPKFLWKNLRYAILIITIVAAVVTPTPDAMTMLVFMVPMLLLYFIGIGVAAFVVRGKRRRAAREGTA